MTVDAGMTFQNNPGGNLQSFNILNSIIHPNYNATENDFDLAIIEIDGSFIFNNFVQPVELVGVNTEFADDINNNVRVSGWGWTQPGVFSPSDQLQAVDVPIISNQEADQQLDISSPNHPELTNRMIATSAVAIERQGGCHGDSGGPLVFRQNNQNDIQVGVVSWGVPLCNGGQNSPTIYARVREFTEWINENIWDFEILGSDSICNSETYTISDIPIGSIVTWEAIPSGVVNLSNTTGASATLTQIQNGNIELIANIELSTASLFVSKDIVIPDTSSPDNLVGILESTGEISASVDLIAGATAYRWYINNNFKKQTSIQYTSIFNNGQGGLLAVEGVTDCGLTSRAQNFVQKSNGGWGNSFYQVYPNPSSSQVTIKEKNQPQEKNKRSYNREDNKLYIVNQKGNVIFAKENADIENGENIDVSQLRSGIYTIVITKNGKVESNQLIISK